VLAAMVLNIILIFKVLAASTFLNWATHSEDSNEIEEEKYEELCWFSSKARKKIEDDVETDRYDEFDRNIRDDSCQSFRKGMIKGVRSADGVRCYLEAVR
jgi:hypothetical protein